MTCKSFNTEDICEIEMHETLNTQANKVSIKLHLNLPPFQLNERVEKITTKTLWNVDGLSHCNDDDESHYNAKSLIHTHAQTYNLFMTGV